MKTNIKKSCKNYRIKDDKLFYKKTFKFKNNIGKWGNKFVDLYVPTIIELNEYLFKYHIQSCHANYKELKYLFNKNNIGFIGIDNIIENYVSSCPVCCQSSKDIKRKDPVKI